MGMAVGTGNSAVETLSNSAAGVMVSGVSIIDGKGRIPKKKKNTKNLERRKAEMRDGS